MDECGTCPMLILSTPRILSSILRYSSWCEIIFVGEQPPDTMSQLLDWDNPLGSTNCE